jgi:hypothetical protein
MAADHTVNVVVNGFNVIAVNGEAVLLTIVAPTNAGDASAPVTNSTTPVYLDYTSIRSAGNGTVTGQITGTGVLPLGTSLAVTAATPGSGGAGTKGSTNSKQTLSSGSSVILIKEIGSCWTDRGGSHGSQLTYELSVSNWATVVPAETATAITVTYTLL